MTGRESLFAEVEHDALLAVERTARAYLAPMPLRNVLEIAKERGDVLRAALDRLDEARRG